MDNQSARAMRDNPPPSPGNPVNWDEDPSRCDHEGCMNEGTEPWAPTGGHYVHYYCLQHRPEEDGA